MTDPQPEFIRPDWPVASRVHAVATTRRGSAGGGTRAGFNLADHAGEPSGVVAHNRGVLMAALELPAEPVWLPQVHGARVVRLPGELPSDGADAAWTDQPGVVCGILTADCVPVLLCDEAGTRVAAVHAGWRGLAAGVVEAAVARLAGPGVSLLAWMGPAISQAAYEVGPEVRDALLEADTAAAPAFSPSPAGRWLADLPGLTRRRLLAAGVASVSGGQWCTASDPDRFYSHRRDGATGRQATLIWLSP